MEYDGHVTNLDIQVWVQNGFSWIILVTITLSKPVPLPLLWMVSPVLLVLLSHIVIYLPSWLQ